MLYPQAERGVRDAIEIVPTLRNARAEGGIPPTSWSEAHLYANEVLDDLRTMAPYIETLARTRITAIDPRSARSASDDKGRAIVLSDVDVVLAAPSTDDLQRVREQLTREADTTRSRLQGIERRLSDEVFLSRAPADVVKRQRALSKDLREKLSRIEAELSGLS